LMSVTGEPGGRPTRAGIAISDTTSGMFLAQGILVALLHRANTGEGQWVHTSLFEAMLNKLDFQSARYTVDKEVAVCEGNYHPTVIPTGTYDASDGLVNIAASSTRMWTSLCEVLGGEFLLKLPEFDNRLSRYKHRERLNAELNALTSKFTVAELVDRLNAVGVPCGAVLNIGQAFDNPQAQHLRMTRTAQHPVLGDLELIRSPINLSAFPQPEKFHHAAPDPGENSDELLQELGYGQAEIEKMRNAEVIS
jgi:crotonobetainyl-CoA:carnitine CoA-transferase CaiB-like acyl-CoA transferase